MKKPIKALVYLCCVLVIAFGAIRFFSYELIVADNFAHAKTWLKLGANINGRDRKGNTPLVHAVLEAKNFDAATLLVEYGANVNVKIESRRGSDNRRPLYMKSVHSDVGLPFRKLLLENGLDVNARDKYASNFIVACATEDAETIKRMLELGANIHDKDSDGETPFMYAARYNKSVEVLQLLLDAGADINETNESGKTAIKLAIKRHDSQPIEILRFLVEKGAVVDEDLLFHAVYMAKAPIEIIRFLLDKGAPINQKTLLQTVQTESFDKIALLLEYLTKEQKKNYVNDEVLCAQTYELGGRDNNEVIRKIKLLVESADNVNAYCLHARYDYEPKDTFFMKVAKTPELVKFLIKKGVDVNVRSPVGGTPLMAAAEWVCDGPRNVCTGPSNLETVKILLENGADITARDSEKKTAMDYALKCNYRPSGPSAPGLGCYQKNTIKNNTNNDEAIAFLKAEMEKASTNNANQPPK